MYNFSLMNKKVDNLTIPKIIHFIWAGGNKQMGDDEVETVIKWTHKNPDCKILIWVDIQTYFPGNEHLLKFYQDIFSSNSNHNIKIEYADTIDNAIKDNNIIYLIDIEKMGLRNEFVKYEIEKLNPNYGASSDILRYNILYRYGGAYFDTDVNPGNTTLLDGKIFERKEKHTLYIDHLTQRSINAEDEKRKITIKELESFTLDKGLGNDALVSTKENPILFLIIKMVENNYDLNKRTEEVKLKRLEIAHGDFTRFSSLTIDRTGPSVIFDILNDEDLESINEGHEQFFIKEIDTEKVEIKRLRDGKNLLIDPGINTCNWLKVPINRFNDSEENLNEVLNIVLNTIEFEEKYFNIIRLDEHISYLKISTENENAEEILLNQLEEKHLIQKNLYGQVKFNYLKTMNFYEKNRIETVINYLKNDDKKDENYISAIIDYECSTDIDKEFASAERKLELLDYGTNFIAKLIKYIESTDTVLHDKKIFTLEKLLATIEFYYQFSDDLGNFIDETIYDNKRQELFEKLDNIINNWDDLKQIIDLPLEFLKKNKKQEEYTDNKPSFN
ncbi:MAG: hypothetical protein LEGION0398_MBIBDBAK_01333 [Legionellaceae bacterium]